MSLRNYNKIYVNTDREEGSANILLGYQNSSREIILNKNTETVFHVPYYTAPLKIADSTLIQDGATAGPFPAASDRVFKNRKNYGNVTTNGSSPSDLSDGVWFCSWLYKDVFGNVQWMDRYYNPGHLDMSMLVAQLTEGPTYEKHDPIYRDVPSTMVFESGVQYKYFHVGENTANQLVTTFNGISGERLKLSLENWGTDPIDTSLSAKNVKIATNGTLNNLFVAPNENDRISAPVINFNNNQEIEVSVEYDPSYCLTNEYSLAFWVQSNNWDQSQSTQLVGNFSSEGGVGIFIDTLSSYPFFVIPETGYGHLLYINEGLKPFFDKSVQSTFSLTATPQFIALDSDNNVIVCYADDTLQIHKFDSIGKLLATTKLIDTSEVFCQLICGPNDTVIVITDKSRYTYDSNLVLLDTTSWQTLSSTVACYSYDKKTGTSELLSFNNVYDSKFIETTHWSLSTTKGNLYKKSPEQSAPELFAELSNIGTTFAIDPYNRIWVLHGTNKVSVYDSNLEALSDPLFQFTAGPDISYIQKNISFICSYERSTNARAWRCLIYCAAESDQTTPQLYAYDMSGNLTDTIDMLSLFDLNSLVVLKQEQQKLGFFGKGDFTGYERKRVFNTLPPYNSQSQIILRASVKDKTKSTLPYTQIKTQFSINNWVSPSWQHIIVTLQNRTFRVYVNGIITAELPYSGNYELSYELQPVFFIGSSNGSQAGLNEEIKHVSAIFNGMFSDVKIYDYVLEQKTMEIFQRKVIPAQDMYWTLPTPAIQYIEKIERMFKNKIPGSKATYFNIKLSGTQIKDAETRSVIEAAIRDLVSKIQPVYANFLKVHWVD